MQLDCEEAKINFLKRENINLKLQLEKYKFEIDSLLGLIDISGNLFKNGFFLKGSRNDVAKARSFLIESVFMKKYIEASGYGMALFEVEGVVITFNSSFKEIFPQMLKNSNIYKESFFSSDLKNKFSEVSLYEDEKGLTFEESEIRNGEEFHIRYRFYLFYFQDKKIVMLSAQNITSEKKLEKKFLQAQKMEAIGRLAGGIAHDFNNVLGVILGYATFLAENPYTETLKEDILEIKKAAEKGAGLTRHLLNFSKKKIGNPQVLNISNAIFSLEKFIRRIIGENIELKIVEMSPRAYALIDETELEQVIMNLSVNAKDAMPNGGKIFIGVYEEEAFDKNKNLPSKNVIISFKDTGIGMSEEVKKKIFEPFFTTKGKNNGTGLGLSTVYSIISKYGGDISVKTAPNEGCEFLISLPCLNENTRQEKEEAAISLFKKRSAGILIADDEESLNKINKRILEERGYRVYCANGVCEALDIISRHKDIELVLTDMVMKDGNGWDLMEKALFSGRDLRFIVITGYDDEEIKVYAHKKATVIKKPYDADKLCLLIDRELSGSQLSNQ